MTGPAALDRGRLAALLARPGVRPLLEALAGPDDETRIVGGAVRDALLGRPVGDLDLVTTALPRTVMRRANRAGLRTVPTGLAHGTVTVLAGEAAFEVTTLREDVDTDGRHATVRFGRDFDADARRRDLTINAFSVTPDGRLHDPVGGWDDLLTGRVRFIGDPERRIREDYLRTLRFFRFHAHYAAGEIDRPGFLATIRARDGLAILSRERVRTELLKLLAAPRGPETAALLSEGGLLGPLVGGVGDPGRLARAADADADATGRLAAYLCATREDADRLREQLRLSNAEHGRLDASARAAARLRSLPGPAAPADLRRLAFAVGTVAVADALAGLAGESRPGLTTEAEALAARYRDGTEGAPVFPLTGRDLVTQGVPPGPEIGRQLAAARDAWLAAGCPGQA